VEDGVQGPAVPRDHADRLVHLALGRIQLLHGVEVLRCRPRYRSERFDGGRDAPGGIQHPAEEDYDDWGDDEQEEDVSDPPDGHCFLACSATIAALSAT